MIAHCREWAAILKNITKTAESFCIAGVRRRRRKGSVLQYGELMGGDNVSLNWWPGNQGTAYLK